MDLGSAIGWKEVEKLVDYIIAQVSHFSLITVIEPDPYLNSIVVRKGRLLLAGYEPDARNFVTGIVVLSQKIEHDPLVDFLGVSILLIHLECKAASFGVDLIFPRRLDILPEVVNGVNLAPLALDLVPRL